MFNRVKVTRVICFIYAIEEGLENMCTYYTIIIIPFDKKV